MQPIVVLIEPEECLAKLQRAKPFPVSRPVKVLNHGQVDQHRHLDRAQPLPEVREEADHGKNLEDLQDQWERVVFPADQQERLEDGQEIL